MANFDNLIQSALTALAAGRSDTARRLLTSLVATDPNQEKAWLYLAVSLPREQAIQALQRVLVLNPGNKQALRCLQVLRKDTEARLDLADVLVEEEEDEVAVFGNEPATIPEARLSTIFGDEPATLPAAFHRVVNGNAPPKKVYQTPEPGLIGTLLAEEWTAHPARPGPPPGTGSPFTSPVAITVEKKPLPTGNRLVAATASVPEKRPLPTGRQLVASANPNLDRKPIAPAYQREPVTSALSTVAQKQPVLAGSWADAPSEEVAQAKSPPPPVLRPVQDNYARVSANIRSAGSRFPVSSLLVDPHSIEARAASVTRNPVAPPPIEQPARWVRSLPYVNVDAMLPRPKPSSNRRTSRTRTAPAGLTSFGYFLFTLLVVVVVVYLYLILKQPLPLNP